MFVVLSTVLAAPVVHDEGLIARDLAQGLISPEEALFLRFQAHFDGEGLPPRYVGSVDEGWACGTGLVMELKQAYPTLRPEHRERIDEVLVPWGGTLDQPFSAPLAPPASSDTCWGQQGAKRILTDNFSVEYDASVSDAKAEQLGQHMEEGLASLVDEYGWTLARGQGNYKMLVFISSQNGGGAYTTAENCSSGGSWMPYIVTYQNVLDGDWSRSMAAHEYNHAQQYSYGFGHKFWYWEATATYIEELVHPSSNWWSPYVMQGYSSQPEIGMEESSQQDQAIFNHMYGMAVWPFHLDEHAGGPDLVLETWKYARSHGDQYDLDMDVVVEAHGLDWAQTYTDFMAANTVFDYDDRPYFGDIKLMDTVRDFPESGGESTPPGRWGQHYVEIDLDDVKGQDIVLDFSASKGGDWYVLLVGTSSATVMETVRVDISDGEGSGRMTGTGRFSKAFLVVSPDQDNAGAYSWELALEDPDGEEEEEDTGAALDTGNPAFPGEGGTSRLTTAGGCACAGGPLAPGPALLLFGLAALRRRA